MNTQRPTADVYMSTIAAGVFGMPCCTMCINPQTANINRMNLTLKILTLTGYFAWFPVYAIPIVMNVDVKVEQKHTITMQKITIEGIPFTIEGVALGTPNSIPMYTNAQPMNKHRARVSAKFKIILACR
jgi:hypothetical protein